MGDQQAHQPILAEGVQPNLADYLPGSKLAELSKVRFKKHREISLLVALGAVVLAIPVFVWPLGERLEGIFCTGRSYPDCEQQRQCYWEVNVWDSWDDNEGTCYSKRIGVYKLWGSVLLQFVFAVTPTYGGTIRQTIIAVLGTALAWSNTVLLRLVFGSGAYADRVPVGASMTLVNSGWLPLCHDGGSEALANPNASCLLNVWTDQVTAAGCFKAGCVLLDLAVFCGFFLVVPLEPGTQLFTLSMHVYFTMLFLDPSNPDFFKFPSIAEEYTFLVCLACIASILLFRFVPGRFDAHTSAKELKDEAMFLTKLLVKSIPDVTDMLCHEKADRVLIETRALLQELKLALDLSWFEVRGMRKRKQQVRQERHLLKNMRLCLEESLKHLEIVFHCAHHVDGGRDDIEALCSTLFSALSEFEAHQADSVFRLGSEHWKLQRVPSAEDSAGNFAFFAAAHGIMEDFRCAINKYHGNASVSRYSCRRVLRGAYWHFTTDRIGRHYYFIIRHTLTICLSFVFVGWLGIPGLLPAYSSYPAMTVSLVVVTYTGSSFPLTLKRVAAVVFGKVLGAIIQLLFGVRIWWRASVYALVMFCVVGYLFFLYLHVNQKDLKYVCSVSAAFAASAMIPAEFTLQWPHGGTFNTTMKPILNTIISTVLAVGFITVGDLFAGRSALPAAKLALLRALQEAAKVVRQPRAEVLELNGMLHQLDSLLPLIEAEPLFGKAPVKLELYQCLQQHLGKVSTYIEAVSWTTIRLGSRLDISILEGYATELGDMLEATSSLAEAVMEQRESEDAVRQVYDSLHYSPALPEMIHATGICSDGTMSGADPHANMHLLRLLGKSIAAEIHSMQRALLLHCKTANVRGGGVAPASIVSPLQTPALDT